MAVVAAALLIFYQLVETRLLSFRFWSHSVYFVISLGFAGTSIAGWFLARRKNKPASNGTAFFAASIFLLLEWIILGRTTTSIPIGQIIELLLIWSCSLGFYASLGYILCNAISRAGPRAQAIYIETLLGTATGSVLFALFFESLGGVGSIRVIFVVLFLAQVAMPSRKILARKTPAGKTLIAAVITLVVVLWTPTLSTIPSKHLAKQFVTEKGQILETHWNEIARVDVVETKDIGIRRILLDGDAQAPLFSPPQVKKYAPYLDSAFRVAPYFFRKPKANSRALVIGVGGGADVWTARNFGIQEIDAVEINESTVELLKGSQSEYIGGLLNLPGTQLIHDNGRRFIERQKPGSYDYIILHAVDSFTAFSVGAQVFSESLLYTQEAIEKLLGLLTNDGVLQLSRFYHPGQDRELFRLFVMAANAFAPSEIQNHITTIVDPPTMASPFGTILISKSIITGIENDGTARFADQHLYRVAYPDSIANLGDMPNPFINYSHAKLNGTAETFLSNYPYRATPVTDDRPFFFFQLNWLDLIKGHHPNSVARYETRSGHAPLWTLALVLATAIVMALATAYGLIVKGSFLPTKPAAYFLAIGMGFILCEIALIQKMVLWLGDPSTSTRTVLPTLLLGMAVGGTWLKTPFRNPGTVLLATALTPITIAVLTPVMTPWVMAHPPYIAIWVAVLLSTSAGSALGVAYPLGLTHLATSETQRNSAWSLNAAATVLGSATALPLSIEFGFTSTLALASGMYLVALYCIWKR